MRPTNLYFTEGKTALRYWTTKGEARERVVPFPAALLTAPPDSEAAITPRVLETPAEVLFCAFRALPLAPDAPWALAEGHFSPLYQHTFDALLRMLRKAPEERWCVRGEPGWFLQFGLQEDDGSYTMGAFVLPCGKPAVLTFRAEDLISALPPAQPFAEMQITTVADGLEAQTQDGYAWDTRIRLPMQDNGAALVSCIPSR